MFMLRLLEVVHKSVIVHITTFTMVNVHKVALKEPSYFLIWSLAKAAAASV